MQSLIRNISEVIFIGQYAKKKIKIWRRFARECSACKINDKQEFGSLFFFFDCVLDVRPIEIFWSRFLLSRTVIFFFRSLSKSGTVITFPLLEVSCMVCQGVGVMIFLFSFQKKELSVNLCEGSCHVELTRNED